MDHAASQKIEKRAYELFVARGGVHGYHFEDWLRAEKEVLGGAAPKAAANTANTAKKAKKFGK
jgi:hypothetical protein